MDRRQQLEEWKKKREEEKRLKEQQQKQLQSASRPSTVSRKTPSSAVSSSQQTQRSMLTPLGSSNNNAYNSSSTYMTPNQARPETKATKPQNLDKTIPNSSILSNNEANFDEDEEEEKWSIFHKQINSNAVSTPNNSNNRNNHADNTELKSPLTSPLNILNVSNNSSIPASNFGLKTPSYLRPTISSEVRSVKREEKTPVQLQSKPLIQTATKVNPTISINTTTTTSHHSTITPLTRKRSTSLSDRNNVPTPKPIDKDVSQPMIAKSIPSELMTPNKIDDSVVITNNNNNIPSSKVNRSTISRSRSSSDPVTPLGTETKKKIVTNNPTTLNNVNNIVNSANTTSSTTTSGVGNSSSLLDNQNEIEVFNCILTQWQFMVMKLLISFNNQEKVANKSIYSLWNENEKLRKEYDMLFLSIKNQKYELSLNQFSSNLRQIMEEVYQILQNTINPITCLSSHIYSTLHRQPIEYINSNNNSNSGNSSNNIVDESRLWKQFDEISLKLQSILHQEQDSDSEISQFSDLIQDLSNQMQVLLGLVTHQYQYIVQYNDKLNHLKDLEEEERCYKICEYELLELQTQ